MQTYLHVAEYVLSTSKSNRIAHSKHKSTLKHTTQSNHSLTMTKSTLYTF